MATDNKKISKKTIIGVVTFVFLISPLSLLRAEVVDYPAGFVGPGYRENISWVDQYGYRYMPEYNPKADRYNQARVDARNQAEEIAASASQATPESAKGILDAQFQHQYNADNLNREITTQQQQRIQAASAQAPFTYIPYSDGKTVYFKDGLVDHIENERVVDEFGNLNIRNSYNYQYDGKRLLTGFEADTKDALGNISHIRQHGMKYTADSLFYGGKDTSANKNITEYFVEETDPAGNKNTTHFYAGTYEGKFLRAFSETIEDNIYGKASFTRPNINYAGGDPTRISSYHEEGIGTDNLAYTSDRTNISYNDKDQLTSYHEVILTTQIDGTQTKTTAEAKFKYLGVSHQFGPDVEEPDPNRLLESIITAITENADGSTRTETATTTYKYEGNQLIGASRHSNFNGQESDWYEYTDSQGHILARNVDQNSNITYSYVDPDTLQTIILPVDQVTTTLRDGNKYTGSSETKHETPYGKPMTKEVHSLVSYYYGHNISDNELIRSEDSTITYNNGLVTYKNGDGVSFSKVQLLDFKEHTAVSSPLLDPDNSHGEIRDINTTYYYDEKGNFDVERGGAYASGMANGWEYSSEKGWYGKYTSSINIDNEVILGKVLRKRYYEDKYYEK